MFYVSEINHENPNKYENETQRLIYETLEVLEIPFDRVENDKALTMEDCLEINKKLDVRVVKNLFVCNQQKTKFYLFITLDNKTFKSKDFSKALDISRVSFAPEEYLEKMLGTKIGATTIFSVVYDKENEVNVVIDKDALKEKYYACNDGTNNAHIKIETERLLADYLPYTKHEITIIELPENEK